MLDFVSFCIDFIFLRRNSTFFGYELDAKNRARSNTHIERRAGGFVPEVDDNYQSAMQNMIAMVALSIAVGNCLHFHIQGN